MSGNSDGEVKKAYRIHGRVQGVGFRWWTQRQASALNLRGSVRNCPDGTVEIAIAGSPDDVRAMLERLQQGPSAANVVQLEELTPPDSLPSDFRIG